MCAGKAESVPLWTAGNTQVSRYLRMTEPKKPQTSDAGRPASGRVDVRTVPKPWGHETIWAHSDRYVGKVLHIKAGHALSVQYHNMKDETVHLLSGELVYRVQLGETLE